MSSSATPGVVILPLPQNSSIHITGFTNSGGWSQRIIVAPQVGPVSTWTSTGTQHNAVVGQVSLPPNPTPNLQIKVQMQFDPGGGFQMSSVQVWTYETPGLAGYVIGGQDGGGRPSGPAFWNTLAFVYWAVGY